MNFSFCIDIYQMLCKKETNQNIYVIGDHHFFHNNIISDTRSQFHDILDVNSEFSDIFQEVSSIKPQDTLIACEKIIRELQLKK